MIFGCRFSKFFTFFLYRKQNARKKKLLNVFSLKMFYLVCDEKSRMQLKQKLKNVPTKKFEKN